MRQVILLLLVTCIGQECVQGQTEERASSKQGRPEQQPAAKQKITRDIKYSRPDGHSLKLDLYQPVDAASPTPVIVFVHGGGWKNGDKKSGGKNAGWLTEHGFAIASIQYRLTDKAQWPAQINDCYEAVRWVRKNADKYDFDPNHIAAWGTSAGGHLVVLMGTRACPEKETVSSRVQAVCDWFGPSELLTMPPNNVGNGRTEEDIARSNGAKLLGATVRDVPELARDASGIDHVTPDDPAFLIMHGDKDPGVPIEQSRRLHQRLTKAGVDSTLHVVKGAGHGGKQFASPESRDVVLSFFNRTLKPAWNQGAGPGAAFSNPNAAPPANWSVVRNRHIRWTKTLPETGQSTVVTSGDRIFFTTLKPVSEDSQLGHDIVAWCCDADTGETLWTAPIAAPHPLRLSGCFSDSSGPPPVTDGRLVCFFNASGRIECFNMEGERQWALDAMPVGRSQPFLHNGAVVFTRQTYMPDEHGHFTHEHKNAPLDQWTQLQAIDLQTGKERWTSECGANMGCVPVLQQLTDGTPVIVVGRGGGHSPPERPEGISMIRAEDGSTLWTLPLPGFMSTMTLNVVDDEVLVFHGGEHLWVNATSGRIAKRVSIIEEIHTRMFRDGKWSDAVETLKPGKNKREIIQQSNVLAGDYHYFRSYTRPWLGRVNVKSGAVEYLQLPVQLKRTSDSESDALLWTPEDLPEPTLASLRSGLKKKQKQIPITQWAFAPNDMKNSRGFVVMGDNRSRGTGWGHHASAVPTVAGHNLYVPVMNGTVYVLKADADKLDEKTIIGINDLGPVGKSFHRASLSLAGHRAYAHTIRQIICIEKSAAERSVPDTF